jgi:hypothetical protein
MRYKRKLIAVMVVVAVLTVIQFLLPDNSRVVAFYDAWIFRPFQSARNVVFSLVPISVGDILYIIGGIVLVVTVGRWLYFIVRFRTRKHDLAHSLLHTIVTLGVVYIIFILGWGGNYYKTPLADYWGISHEVHPDSSMAGFDRFLVGQLNTYAPGYHEERFKDIDERAQNYYKDYTDSRTRAHGIKAKASIFGFWMQHLAIQGYYNPFTGEAQVNRFLPPFMLPFVICHEMAHQAGIAAEDDANLLAYAVGSTPRDSLFRYSSYLNLWLYTHARLRQTDSSLAKALRAELNPLTLSHLDTLKAIRMRYASDVADYSGALYDGYLRLHHQKDGIESYNKVAVSAWEWEQRRDREGVIRIP